MQFYKLDKCASLIFWTYPSRRCLLIVGGFGKKALPAAWASILYDQPICDALLVENMLAFWVARLSHEFANTVMSKTNGTDYLLLIQCRSLRMWKLVNSGLTWVRNTISAADFRELLVFNISFHLIVAIHRTRHNLKETLLKWGFSAWAHYFATDILTFTFKASLIALTFSAFLCCWASPAVFGNGVEVVKTNAARQSVNHSSNVRSLVFRRAPIITAIPTDAIAKIKDPAKINPKITCSVILLLFPFLWEQSQLIFRSATLN